MDGDKNMNFITNKISLEDVVLSLLEVNLEIHQLLLIEGHPNVRPSLPF